MKNMASPARDSQLKRGRPKLGISIKRIGLQANIYDEWIAKKKGFGFAQKSNSDFAKYLLRISDEHRGQTSPSTVGEFISMIFFKDVCTMFRSTGIGTRYIVVLFLSPFRSLSFNACKKTE